MSTDQAKSTIDRLVGVVWAIEPSKTPMPTIGPDLAHSIAMAHEPLESQKKPRVKKNAPETETSEH
jgi:hypothetical protein